MGLGFPLYLYARVVGFVAFVQIIVQRLPPIPLWLRSTVEGAAPVVAAIGGDTSAFQLVANLTRQSTFAAADVWAVLLLCLDKTDAELVAEHGEVVSHQTDLVVPKLVLVRLAILPAFTLSIGSIMLAFGAFFD